MVRSSVHWRASSCPSVPFSAAMTSARSCGDSDTIDSTGAETLLQGLRARRKLYVEERRDPYLLSVLDKAIVELEQAGDLESLSNQERAALEAHTITVDLGRPPMPSHREYTFG